MFRAVVVVVTYFLPSARNDAVCLIIKFANNILLDAYVFVWSSAKSYTNVLVNICVTSRGCLCIIKENMYLQHAHHVFTYL